ncbi:hypothetical protein Tco_0574798, partial [Tanacetum coccineum]
CCCKIGVGFCDTGLKSNCCCMLKSCPIDTECDVSTIASSASLIGLLGDGTENPPPSGFIHMSCVDELTAHGLPAMIAGPIERLR